MLNSNEKEILNCIQDEKYMNCIGANFDDIETAIKLGINEFNELEEIINVAFKNKENFQSLSKRLKGHNENFSGSYPEYNYFDLNYKSLLVTVKEKLDKNNTTINYHVMKSDVFIYPDNISKSGVDEMCVLNLEEPIDFEKVRSELENERYQEENM